MADRRQRHLWTRGLPVLEQAGVEACRRAGCNWTRRARLGGWRKGAPRHIWRYVRLTDGAQRDSRWVPECHGSGTEVVCG